MILNWSAVTVEPDQQGQGDSPNLGEAQGKRISILQRLSALLLAFALATSPALGWSSASVLPVVVH